jgi:hypothetical protein
MERMNQIKRLSAAALALLLLAACSSDTTTQPSAPDQAPGATTAASKGQTTAPPQATVLIVATARETEAAPAISPQTGPIATALSKFTSVKSYRATLDMLGKGALGLTDSETEKSDQEVTLFSVTGDFAGSDSSYVIKGFLSSLLGVDADKGMQAMIVGDKGYVKGPVSMLGAMESKWYVLDMDQSEAIAPPFLASEFLSELSNSNVETSAFKKTGTEKLDGKTCDVYTANQDDAIKTLSALNTGVLPAIGDMATIMQAEAAFSVCDDGYLHRVRLLMDTVDNENKDLKSTYIITMRISNFNAAVKLTPPTNAEPLATPDYSNDESTPTP